MKTLILSTMLLLIISGGAWADEPKTTANDPQTTADETQTASIGGGLKNPWRSFKTAFAPVTQK